MKKYLSLVVLVMLLVSSGDLHAQKKKLRKAKNEKDLFVPERAKANRQGPSVNPIRKVLNMFNLSFETGAGFFNFNQELTNVVLVRTQTPASLLYIFPSGSAGAGPFMAEANWFNSRIPISIDQIYDSDVAVNTDTMAVTLNNKGTFKPTTLRVSLSLKKMDKLHLKTTGEKRSLDVDLLRFGGGISFGKVEFTDAFLSVKDIDNLGTLPLPVTKTSQSKLFGSLSINAWSYDDLTLFVDLEAGTWKLKARDFNTEVVKYDPFYSIGLTFEKKFSKYFKIYVKPAVEFRNYNWISEGFSIPNKFNMFSISLGFLIKYPTYPRNRFNGHQVQMEHVFNGKIYRGRSIFRPQNPRIGQNQKKSRNRR